MTLTGPTQSDAPIPEGPVPLRNTTPDENIAAPSGLPVPLARATESGESSEGPSREIAPGPFCGLLLKALEAAEGQTRRRKRDQSPDRLGLAIKRDLLERAVADDPDTVAFEGWLVEQIAGSEAPGSVRAMCEQIFLEYRMVRFQPDLADWL